MNSKITYNQLRKELLQIGFSERSVGSHLLLYNSKMDSSIVMPLFKSTKIAEPYFISAVKNNLVGKGVLTAQQFAELLSKYTK